MDLLQKILTHLCGLNFCIYYNCSSHFQPTIIKQRNGPKCIQTLRNKNKSLGSNGVDWVRSLRNILTRLRVTNFCTSSARFAPSFVRQPNNPKCTKIVQNAPKLKFRVRWGGSGAFLLEISNATSLHGLLH